jgi:hypothetical protein
MSASIVYHGFGIRGYQYERSFYEDGTVTFVIFPGPRPAAVSAVRHFARRAPRGSHARFPLVAHWTPASSGCARRRPGVL